MIKVKRNNKGETKYCSDGHEILVKQISFKNQNTPAHIAQDLLEQKAKDLNLTIEQVLKPCKRLALTWTFTRLKAVT